MNKKFAKVIDKMKSLESDYHNLDDFRRPLETIAQALDNSTQSDIGEHSRELIAGLVDSFLGFVQGQFYWYREANYDEAMDALNDDLIELRHSLEASQ